MKSVTLLGSTGTIGVNTLDIVAMHEDRFRIEALTAGDNAFLLAEQARRFGAKRAVIANESHYHELKALLSGSGIEAACGEEAVITAAGAGSDIVVSAIVGAAALKPTLSAIRAGSHIALANKECLVCAGELVNKELAASKATIVPVDSEHNAIFQVFDRSRAADIVRVTLTASGGPFRNWSTQQMKAATPEQAVRHPNWNMGAKISVDSATLMNKGLELIEAYYLFPLKVEQLGVLVHPQSIVHCLVEMKDGSVLSQLSHPDMRVPLAHALAFPERIATPAPRLDLAALGSLEFFAPDDARFPAPKLALAALSEGGSAPAVLNAANEVAVGRFLSGEIGFLDIIKIVERTLENRENVTLNTLEDVMACDKAARAFAKLA